MTFTNITIPLRIYFDIDYKIACVIAIFVFGVYLIMLLRTRLRSNNEKKAITTKDCAFGILLSVYIALLISWTVLNRNIKEEYQIKFIPFWSYAELYQNWSRHLAMQIFYNVLLFVPWGILFPTISKSMQKIQRVIISAFGFSALVEIIQLVFKSGLFEFDDMFHNTLGSVLGYAVWYGVTQILPNVSKKDVERRPSMNNLISYQMQLLDLVSFALFGGDKCNTSLTPEILKEANQQAVLTLMKVEKENSPDFYLMHAQTLVNNVRIDYEHAEVHRMMMKAEIPYVILKGSSSASYYPEPLLRTMGDVDLLISKSDLPKVDVILQENGFHPIEKNDNECHLAYHRRTYGATSTWEVHWKPNGIPSGKSGAKIEGYLADIIASAQRSNVSEGEYMVPTAFHHGLVMLLHVAGHLINTGIGLRHLCDWAVFVAKFSDEEFCEMFEDKLKAVGLWRFAQLLTQLSVKYLHCPTKEWCDVGDDDYLEMMMVDIMNGGNFGVKDKNRINQAKLMTNTGKGVDDTSLLKQLFLTMNQKARLGMPITAKVPLLLPVGWLYVVGRHLVRIKQKRRPTIDVKDMIAGAAERKEIYKEFRLFEAE